MLVQVSGGHAISQLFFGDNRIGAQLDLASGEDDNFGAVLSHEFMKHFVRRPNPRVGAKPRLDGTIHVGAEPRRASALLVTTNPTVAPLTLV